MESNIPHTSFNQVQKFVDDISRKGTFMSQHTIKVVLKRVLIFCNLASGIIIPLHLHNIYPASCLILENADDVVLIDLVSSVPESDMRRDGIDVVRHMENELR